MAKMEETNTSQAAFRDRARQEYEERRAQGRLGPAQRTCETLDEKAGIKVSLREYCNIGCRVMHANVANVSSMSCR